MLRFGGGGPAVLIAPPLFEEANRTRAALVNVARRLAATGCTVTLPDLPGQGESIVPTSAARLPAWRAALAAAARTGGGRPHVLAWRGGALLDAEVDAASRWYLAPVTGAAIVRDLRRARSVSGGELYAGNALSDELLTELDGAEPMTPDRLRVARLQSDPHPADVSLPGRPLWRAAEPGTDESLQAAVAGDVVEWIARCGG